MCVSFLDACYLAPKSLALPLNFVGVLNCVRTMPYLAGFFKVNECFVNGSLRLINVNQDYRYSEGL